MYIDNRLRAIITTLTASGYEWIQVGIVPVNANRTVTPRPRWIPISEWLPYGRALTEMGCNGDGQRIEFWLDERHPEYGACVRERWLYPVEALRVESKRTIWLVRRTLP